ncbi:M12 family metallopeptidase [Chryseobacterium gallinarum]|uniref:M12 family metallopeptidase n=1 Tax=Chryseobacterium gallinarum TaxID=1324352 RepID=UPI0020251C36|nr:M12 family metallopeptidase [Chryseobacterium gallinarum]MCL8535440.1 M12 family metallopeptidase [Chryseobacterium gallinarum]
MKTKPKVLISPIIFAGYMAVAFLSSCDKNNDDPVINTVQTQKEEIRKGQLNGQPITYVRKDGKNFFQGDIVLTDEQLDGSQKKGGASYSLWPSGNIYYTIASNMGSINRDKIINAINQYNSYTNTKWIARTNQSNYVQFIFGSQTGSDGWAHIGYRGGVQTISLDQYISVGSVIHEMGHTVGLYHEHTRQDRDQYVRILWDNIQSGQSYNFDKYTSGVDIGPFNINSVMMYWPTSYSRNGQPTITRANGSSFTYTRTGFTTGDINTINAMYP